MADGYEGREPALIKHTLLKNYLQKLFLVVGMGAKEAGRVELCYVDCFSGPWQDETKSLGTTSIAISLQTLDECRRLFIHRGVNVAVRALYVEKNARAFARLSNYLSGNTPSGIQAECMEGDFVALRDKILRWCGPSAFVFFFVDPMGWKAVGIETLRPLLRRARSEFLINFMYDFINRTVSMSHWRKDIIELLGEPIDVEGLEPSDRESRILHAYRRNIKACITEHKAEYKPRSGYVRVLGSGPIKSISMTAVL